MNCEGISHKSITSNPKLGYNGRGTLNPVLYIDTEAHVVMKTNHPNCDGRGSAKGKEWLRQDRCFMVMEAREDR